MRAAKIAGLIAGGAAALLAFPFLAGAETIDLTEEQTVALYGTEFTANFHGHFMDSYTSRQVTFHYVGKLSDFGYMDNGGGFGGIQSNYMEQGMRADIANLRGCVYTASPSDWGGGDFPTANSAPWNGSIDWANGNINLRMSVDIGGYTEMTQYIGWSTGTYNYYDDSHNGYYKGYQNSNGPYKNVSGWRCLNVAGSGSTVISSGNAIGGFTYAGVPYCGFATMPTYAYYNNNPVDETRLTRFAFNRVFATTETTGLPISAIQIQTQVNQQSTVLSSSDAPTGDLWIIIGCPHIRDYVPASTTATTVQTTRYTTRTGLTGLTGIGTTQTGVDMSQISVDLREIIFNQRWQIAQNEVITENTRRIANNTDTIVQQLNAIYALLVQNGDLPVTTDDTMLAAIGSAIEGYTTAQIPEDPAQNIGFWVALVDFIMSRYQLAELAAFSVCAGVTGWILFRGRTS